MTNILPKGYPKESERSNSPEEKLRQQTVQNINEQANLVSDIVAKIRQEDREGEILSTSVQCIRQALDCDRAVIYSFQGQNRHRIVAESVARAYPRIIGTKIIDPCFEDGYIDKYQMGRVRAISDIYQAGMTPCHISNLEENCVRASLVVPLLCDSETLYGLLILHQCDAPREWQQTEIDLTIQIAIQIGFILKHALQLAKYRSLERKLEKANEWQKLLPKICQQIYSGRSPREVLQITADQTQKLLLCDRVVVYSLQGASTGKIVAEVTKSSSITPIVGRMMVDPCFDRSYAAEYQNGRVRAISNIYGAGLTPCYQEALERIGVKANLVAPILRANGKLLGLLVVHECVNERKWKSHEVEWMCQIARQCGLAVTNARLRQEQESKVQGAKQQALVESLMSTIANAANQLHQTIEIGTDARAATAELEAISREIYSFVRLLAIEQEALNGSAASVRGYPPHSIEDLLEPHRQGSILPLVTKRLQQKIETWQTTLDRLLPQQQRISDLLAEIVATVDNSHLHHTSFESESMLTHRSPAQS